MQLPKSKSFLFSADVEKQFLAVFEKHKEYCLKSRKFNGEALEDADTDFNLYVKSMLHVYKGFLDVKLSELDVKLKYL